MYVCMALRVYYAMYVCTYVCMSACYVYSVDSHKCRYVRYVNALNVCLLFGNVRYVCLFACV